MYIFHLSVYGDGSRDARDVPELSVNQKFFDLQEPRLEKFVLKLNVTNQVHDGRRYLTAFGTSYLNIFINDPPENGTCSVRIRTLDPDTGLFLWTPAKTGRALIDEFLISCAEWKDPDSHRITKYVFKSERLSKISLAEQPSWL